MAHVYARPHHMLQTEEEVLDIVEDDPSTSTREIARQDRTIQFLNVGVVVLHTSDTLPITEDDNQLDSDPVDLAYLGGRAFSSPDPETGKKVENWNEASPKNPEELGEYAEGDIVFPERSRNGMVAQTFRWKDGVVPYEIAGSFSSSDLDRINRAIAIYKKYTCVTFRPRTANDKDYISIVSGRSGCWSSVGRIGGKQEVNLQSPSCTTKVGTPLHELMHAIGFLHEQNRYERDDYVDIVWRNIKNGHKSNFDKADKGTTDGFGVEYDYRSVMHYSNTAFSINGQPTIIPKDSSKVKKIGQRDGFSRGDITKINAMYNCPEKTLDVTKGNSSEPLPAENTDKENIEKEQSSNPLLFRHGARTPIKTYRNDPYADVSCWPEGYGQLTNIGKEEQFQLGRWLRERYDHFLPRKYHKNDITVSSSNFDRCLMSAAVNLAGLYPPEDDQIWNKELLWQPIPIHTAPIQQDPLLAQQKACPKFNRLCKKLTQTKLYQNYFKQYSDLFQYLSEHSGDPITNFEQMRKLYDTLFVQNLNNMTLPNWTKAVFPKPLQEICDFSWTTYTDVPELARLKSGPLINHITTHFENITSGMQDIPKFVMLSAHDDTISNLLNALRVFDGKWPPYSTTVIFELRRDAKRIFLNALYKKSTNTTRLCLPGCDFDCDFGKFVELTKPVRPSLKEWEKECI
ncbi:hypothetical protein NQ317_013519 [Molorchus minor]|uniref:Metalloendopeptidase n=1 Tax=Molorchus minor TaxID=1323400 RepID=A0ABQ9JWY1_9CUCU|nr:hypothetical protein NQ317_013519 [Molorchus minor]